MIAGNVHVDMHGITIVAAKGAVKAQTTMASRNILFICLKRLTSFYLKNVEKLVYFLHDYKNIYRFEAGSDLVKDLEKEVLREMQERIVKSFLDVLILGQLRREPKGAYEILAFVNKKFHRLMSAGTLYSTLYSLERDELIQGDSPKRKSRGRLYTLTDKGKKKIQALLDINEKIGAFMVDFLRGSQLTNCP